MFIHLLLLILCYLAYLHSLIIMGYDNDKMYITLLLVIIVLLLQLHFMQSDSSKC